MQPLVPLGQRAALGHGVHQVVRGLGQVPAAGVAAGVGGGVGVAAHVCRTLHDVVVLWGCGRCQSCRCLVLAEDTDSS